jgi:hypothetical protein
VRTHIVVSDQRPVMNGLQARASGR